MKEETVTMEFPTNRDNLVEDYVALERYLNTKWHKDVNLGAAVNGDGILTDHGVGHVNDVMVHADKILGQNIRNLCGYEIYLLLLAIHFHDLGNIKGREEHETKIIEIMLEMGDALPLDHVERQFIATIATAHGGYVDGDKDTIYYVNSQSCNGVKVRSKLLAAILRFADDFSRTNYKGIEIPEENQVYHEYSKSLEPVLIEEETHLTESISRKFVSLAQQPESPFNWLTGSKQAAVRWPPWRALPLVGNPCTTSLNLLAWMPWWPMPAI